MTGEGRLHRDLRRLAIADLAHQHHVGILPQDRAQCCGEGEACLFLHLHLHDPLHPVLHRVFDRHDVDALALDLVDARVERGGLSRPGRARDEDDPLAEFQQPLDPLDLVGVQSQPVEGLDRGAGVEHPDDDLFAQRCRQRRDAQVDRLAVHGHAGAAILRPQPIGDVEGGHDLDARDQRDAGGAGNLHHLAQHAIDAIPHRDPAFLGLDVNVARARQDPLGDDQVHETNHGPLARLLGRDGELVGWLVGELDDVGAAAHPLEQLVERLLGAVQLVELLGDPRGIEQQGPDLPRGGEGKRLLRIQIERVRRSHLEIGIGDDEGQHPEAARQLLGDLELHLRLHLVHVGDLEAKAGRERREDLLVARDLFRDQRLPEGAVRPPLRAQLGHALGRDHTFKRVQQPFIGKRSVAHGFNPPKLAGAPAPSSAAGATCLTGCPRNPATDRRRGATGGFPCRFHIPTETPRATRRRGRA